MPCPIERLWRFHSSAQALKILTPPGQRVEIEGDAPVENGATHRLRIRRFGVTLRWIARIEGVHPPNDGHASFTDIAERSPFAAWRHEHLMRAEGESASHLTDRVTYTPPFGPLGLLADRLFLRRDIERLFAFRHEATRRTVEHEAAN